ncbi:MAG: TAXI family TRAP transporter solute-binding subunit [Gammaproteobacteria bacterium]
MASRYTVTLFLVLAQALLSAGCDRVPPAEILHSEVGRLLEGEFKSGLFEIVSLRRLGSSRFGDKETADHRMTVFFNLRVRFREAFDLTRWDGLNGASLAYLLGATEKGIEGIRPGGNETGDTLSIHGSRTYALRQGQWRPLAIGSPEPPPGEKAQETLRLVARINELIERSSVRHGGAERVIIDKELGQAVGRIERKLDQQAQVFSAASGPANGAYSLYIEALERHAGSLGAKVRNYQTQGSVENCQLVHSGGVDIAIAQSNITALAREGKGIFRDRGPLISLRAVAALFPEYIQIVVAAHAGTDRLEALRGKRVDVGLPSSGSRVDALRILNAIGLKPPDFEEISETGLNAAIAAMREGRLDAFFVTLQAPGRALQSLLASGEARLLPIPKDVQQLMQEKYPGYRAATLSPFIYPNQEQEVSTLSLIATLIVHQDFPDKRVEQLLDGLFRSVPIVARDNLRVSLLSPKTARDGLTIPMHPAAEHYFAKSVTIPDPDR